MKKSKLLMLCVASFLSLTMVMFAGCTNNNNSNGVTDDTQVESSSSGSNSSNSSTDSGSNGSNSSNNQNDPVVTQPVMQPISTYFTGAKAEYLKPEFTNESNYVMSFNDMLNRQIDLLAEDLIYRLNYVYGNDRGLYGNSADNYDLLFNGNNYVYNGNKAIVNKEKLLTNQSYTYDSTTAVKSPNIDDILQCQIALMPISTANDDNYYYGDNFFKLHNAINGGNMSMKKTFGVLILSGAETEYTWLNKDLNKDFIKLSIAQILSDSTETNYDNLLNKINYLGFSEQHTTKITNFVFNSLIGTELVEKDNGFYNELKQRSVNGIIAPQVILGCRKDESYSYTTNPLIYKAYKVIIPALVSQAVNNTFENSTTKLYPELSRYAVNSTVNATGFNEYNNYNSVVLMPKANVTPTTLFVNLQSDNKSAGNTISVKYEVVINGQVKTGYKTVTLKSSENVIELNLHSITGSTKLKAYDGKSEKDISTSLFGGSPVVTEVDNGNNYIKLTFTNTNDYLFKVEFKGMLDKVAQ